MREERISKKFIRVFAGMMIMMLTVGAMMLTRVEHVHADGETCPYCFGTNTIDGYGGHFCLNGSCPNPNDPSVFYADTPGIACPRCGYRDTIPGSVDGIWYCFNCDEDFPESGQTEGGARITPAPVSLTITYYEYHSSKNPSYETRTVTVDKNSYYAIFGSTVSEYYSSDGVKYVFTGTWDVNGSTYSEHGSFPVLSNVSITPIYKTVYVVTYLNADKKSTFQSFEIDPGEYHRIIAEYPEKEADDKYTYEFAGWTFNDVVVKGYQVINYSKYYYPSYNKIPKTNTITYLDSNGNVYQEESVNAGAKFALPATGPEKEAEGSTGYEFAGWTLGGEPVDEANLVANENMTFVPVYTEYVIPPDATPTPKPTPTPVPEQQDNQDEVPEPAEPTQAVATEEPTPTEVPAVVVNPASDDNIGGQGITDNAGASGNGVSDEQTGTDDEEDLSEELEDLDLDDNETPMGAIVAAGVGTVALVAGAAVVIAKTTGGAAAAGKAVAGTAKAAKAAKAAKTAKTAKNAAKAADAAAKAKAVRDIELESKTVLLAVDNADLKDDLTTLLGEKKFVALKTLKLIHPERIIDTARKVDAKLVIIDTLKGETSQSFIYRVKAICAESHEFKLAAVSNDAYTSVKEDTFKSLKKEGYLVDYTSAGVSDNQKLVKLMLPVFKPEITVDNSAEFIGHVTDALGIPVVSTVVELFVNGKEIKQTLSSKSVDASDISTVVGNIASIFGLDAVEGVSKLINGIDTAKDVLKTEDVTDLD